MNCICRKPGGPSARNKLLVLTHLFVYRLEYPRPRFPPMVELPIGLSSNNNKESVVAFRFVICISQNCFITAQILRVRWHVSSNFSQTCDRRKVGNNVRPTMLWSHSLFLWIYADFQFNGVETALFTLRYCVAPLRRRVP